MKASFSNTTPDNKNPRKRTLGVANALTALRLFLVVPMCWFILNEKFGIASALFCVAVASDVADGRVARARGEVSKFGGLFDHSVDATFVGLALGALAMLPGEPVATYLANAVNPILPLLVLLSFVQYALDSKVLSGQALRASVLGRYNGIGYFVVLGTAVIGAVIGAAIGLPHWLLNTAISGMAWLLVVTTLLSMLDRLFAYRKAPDSP